MKKDEAEFEAAEELKRKNKMHSEGEKRLRVLKMSESDSQSSKVTTRPSKEEQEGKKHVNLFEGCTQSNETMEERQKKRLKDMKQKGITPLGLGQSVYNKTKPWYATSKSQLTTASSTKQQAEESKPWRNKRKPYRTSSSALNDDRMKGLLDPLAQMTSYVNQTTEVLEIMQETRDSKHYPKKHSKHKKHKKKKKKKKEKRSR